MAKFVLTNAYCLINSVDLSDHVESITINYSAEAKEGTAMADGTKINYGGLKEWSVDITFRQNYASGKVDATLFSIVGTQVAVEFRADAGSVSSTNPKFTGTALVQSYNGISGTVGDMANATCNLMCASALTRATS